MSLFSYALTTVQRVKDYLGISVTTYDSLLETLINSVTDWVESQCGGRHFLRTTYSNELYSGDGQTKLILKNYPVLSVSSFQYRTGSLSSPVWNDFNADDYLLMITEGMIYVPGGLPEGVNNIRVTYQAGYLIDFDNEGDTAYHTLPGDIELVVKQLVAKVFDTRKSQGKSSESVEGMNINWSKQITAEQKAVLDKYKIIAL